MKELNEKLEKVNRAIASSATPKEFLPELKKKKTSLENEIALHKQQAEIDTKLKLKTKVAVKKVRAEKEAADAQAKAEKEAAEAKAIADKEAAKKARIRKQLVTGKKVKKKAKSTVKTIGKPKLKRIPKAAKRGKKRAKSFYVPKYVKRFNSGRPKADVTRDSQRSAMAPGKHKQKRGSKHKFYYERRANRTDVSPKKWKLKKGGSLYEKGGPTFKKKDESCGCNGVELREGDRFKNPSGTVFIVDEIYKDSEGDMMVRTSLEGGSKGNYKDTVEDFLALMQEEKAVKLNKGGSLYANGGTIKNQYKGKTPEKVWNSWTSNQRIHFLQDHDANINAIHKKLRNFTEVNSEKWYTNLYRELPDAIHRALSAHVNEGQYAKGGRTNAGLVKDRKYFNKRQKHEVDYASATGRKKVKYKVSTAFLANGGKVHPKKVGIVMREFKAGKLKSHGKVVTDRDQAVAIALSEAGMSKKK
jgi:hypothetical protein